MISRRLLILNGVLAVVSVALAAQVGRVYFASPSPPSVPTRGQPAPKTARPAAEPKRADPSAGIGNYGPIWSKNLFSPNRTDIDTTPTTQVGAVPPAPPPPKPILYGVVIQDSTSIAYLEDPTNKRVAGYKVGDTITGATVQSIAPDRVLLKRAEATVEVKLKDPTKPRPVVAETPARPRPGAPAAGAPGRPPGVLQPGVAQPPQVPPTPGVQTPTGPLRRLPRPLVGRDAPSQ